ncbi:hypothetical protein ACOMHN_040049 [Nucella lapillus]
MKCCTKEYYNEGAATFFRSSRFELGASREVCLTQAAHSLIERTSALAPEVKAAAKEYLDQADVVLVTRLRCKSTGRTLTVGNVHLYWDEDLHPDVKTVQAACAVEAVVTLSGPEGPHIVCGDFNSDSSSPVYQLVTDGHLPPQVQGKASRLCASDFGLRSHMKGAEPEVTCYTDKGWMLDYICDSGQALEVVAILDVVDTDIVVQTGGLPSQDFSSDHLSLKTVFAFV